MSEVSVIIPNYNCALWIAKTLDSCLAQKDFLKEIIVVDDHSTDNSLEILHRYQANHPDLIKLFSNDLKGGNTARNYGFTKSTGSFIQWLDADDQIVADKFSTQLRFFGSHANCDIVYSDWKLVTYLGKEMVKEEIKQKRQEDDFLFELLINNWTAPHNYLLKRDIAEKLHRIKAWNPDTVVFQDREYFTLAAILGAKFAYVPGCFAIYNRWNKSSVSAAATEVRHVYFEKILTRFESFLQAQTWITASAKKKYQDIINTEKLLIRAAKFPSTINYRDTGIFSISWGSIHGFRTRAKFLLEFFKWKLFGN